jgi:hypothetical protein
MRQKPGIKPRALFGLLLLLLATVSVGWVAFSEFSGCQAGCQPVSIFGAQVSR